ncbi:MAG TPA: VWA domain-containing protein [Vicinamibacterales bacterium]|nr:VWA domain-containing protein [Vicinamibacterales bacterium]
MRKSAACCAMAAALALAAGDWPARAQQSFKSGVDLVRVPVVVTGKDGLLTRGLTAKDFEVREDGVKQTITAFAEGAPGGDLELHLGLLLDVSGSMELDLRDAANAAVQFVTGLDEAADATLVEFASTIQLGRFSRDSYPRLFERIRQHKPDGDTALFDAIGVYLETARTRPGQHVLLLYTDGGDNSSKLSYAQLVDALRFSNVLVYAIGYLDNQSSTQRVVQQSRLTMLTRETGGDAFFPGGKRDLQTAYARILDELGSRYTIGYEPAPPRSDGKFHKIQVHLTAPAAKDAKIRARSGYLAPVGR